MKTEKGEYEGEFINGNMEGSGVFQYKDGKRYEGQFLNNTLHGKGILIFPNGQKAVGEWVRGENIRLEGISARKLQKSK